MSFLLITFAIELTVSSNSVGDRMVRNLGLITCAFFLLVGCGEQKSFDRAFDECRYDVTKIRFSRPDMKFDKDPVWDKTLTRSLVAECMRAKGFNSIPADKQELIN